MLKKSFKHLLIAIFSVCCLKTVTIQAATISEILATSTKTTSNQLAVAQQLNSILLPSPEQALIIAELETLTVQELQHSLNQMSGEQYTTLALSTEFAGNRFIRSLYNPIRSTVVTSPSPNSCCYSPCLEVWIQGGGGQAFLNNCKHASNTLDNFYDVSLGVQTIIDRDWTLGIAGCYTEGRLDYRHDGKGKTRSGFGGIYGLYRPIGYYVFADLAFGGSKNHLNRSITINNLGFCTYSNPKAYQVLGYIEAGMDCPLWDLLVQPFFGLEGNVISNRRISESGPSSLNLDIYKHDYGNVYSRLGAHITRDLCCFFVSVDLVWKYQLNPSNNRINAQFQQFGEQFRVKDVKQGQSYFEGAAAISTLLYGNVEAFAEISGIVGYHSSAYHGLGGLKYSW